MKTLMPRLPLLAVALAALLTSCTPAPIEQAVYDQFKLNFLEPEKWDEELDDLREDRVEEKLAFIRQVLVKIDDERMVYAKRCNPLAPAADPNCQTVDDLTRALNALAEVETGLLTGTTLKGGIGERLNYGLDDRRREERARIAKRVRKHFLPEPPPK